MPRKTVEIKYLVERANYFLRESEPEQIGERKGVCSMIELALHQSGNYSGYLHLESAEIDHDGWAQAWERFRAAEESPEIPQWFDYCKDDTRRAYLLKGQPYPGTR